MVCVSAVARTFMSLTEVAFRVLSHATVISLQDRRSHQINMPLPYFMRMQYCVASPALGNGLFVGGRSSPTWRAVLQ